MNYYKNPGRIPVSPPPPPAPKIEDPWEKIWLSLGTALRVIKTFDIKNDPDYKAILGCLERMKDLAYERYFAG